MDARSFFGGRKAPAVAKSIRKGRVRVRTTLAPKTKKAVTAVVKSVIARNQENKMIGWLTELNTPHNTAIGPADCVPLIQQIAPGVSAQQRVGDRIKPRSLRLRGIVSYTPDTCNTTQNLYVRIIIASQKNIKTGADVFAGSVDTAHLLRPGYLGADQTAFTGLTHNLYEPINRDLFRVYLDKVIKLAPSLTTGGGREQQPLYLARYSFRMKQMPANLTYDDGNGNWPNNFAPFITMGYAFSDGTGPDLATFTRIVNNCSAFLEYEDA